MSFHDIREDFRISEPWCPRSSESQSNYTVEVGSLTVNGIISLTIGLLQGMCTRVGPSRKNLTGHDVLVV